MESTENMLGTGDSYETQIIEDDITQQLIFWLTNLYTAQDELGRWNPNIPVIILNYEDELGRQNPDSLQLYY